MVLLRQSSKLYDSLRKKWIEATPEEKVRQKWIQIMIHELGFPSSMISLEKSLQEASLQGKGIAPPNRRLDLICYTKNEEGTLAPLLIVEFKATPLHSQAIEQIIRYNTYIGAKYVAVANDLAIMLGMYDPEKNEYHFTSDLPPYQELKK
jgi:hypothetical protein